MSSPPIDESGIALLPAPETALDAHPAEDVSTGATFAVRPGQALLDGAFACGVDLAHGCRNGVCGACAIEIVEGLENATARDPIEENSAIRFSLPREVRLACRLHVRGPVKFKPG